MRLVLIAIVSFITLSNAEQFKAFMLAHDSVEGVKHLSTLDKPKQDGTGFGYLETPAFFEELGRLYIYYATKPYKVPYTVRLFSLDGINVAVPKEIAPTSNFEIDAQERTTDYIVGFELLKKRSEIKKKYLGVLIKPRTTDDTKVTVIGPEKQYDYTDNLVMAACDPTVVKFKGFYYMFYAGNKDRYNNVIMASRSKSLQEPFAIWSDDNTWKINTKQPKPVFQQLGKLSEAIENQKNYDTMSLANGALGCNNNKGLFRIPGSPFDKSCFNFSKAFSNGSERKFIVDNWNAKSVSLAANMSKAAAPVSIENQSIDWKPVPIAYPIRGDDFFSSFNYGSGEPAAIVYHDEIFVFFWTTAFNYGNDWQQQLGFWELFWKNNSDPGYDDVTKQFQLAYIKYDGSSFSSIAYTSVFAAYPMGQVKKNSRDEICTYFSPKYQRGTATGVIFEKDQSIRMACFQPSVLLNANFSSPYILSELIGSEEFILSQVEGIHDYEPPKYLTDNGNLESCGSPIIQSFDLLSDVFGRELEPKTYAVTLFPEYKDQHTPWCTRGQSWIISKDNELMNRMRKDMNVNLITNAIIQPADHSK